MRFSVTHSTVYGYDRPVSNSFNDARLCPVSDEFQRCLDFSLEIEPFSPILLRRLDFFTNQVHHFEVGPPHERLSVTAHSQVETFADSRDFSIASDFSALAGESVREQFYDFLAPSQLVDICPQIQFETDRIGAPSGSVPAQVERMMDHVYRNLKYATGSTAVHTTVREVLDHRRGVCQDFAHVMLAMCRHAGIPARYVSGYFHTRRAVRGTADDSSESHAWVECFLPGIGWTAYDPTHNRRAGDHYVKVAVGRDYSDVRPLSGSYRGEAAVTMQVAVSIRPAGQPDPEFSEKL